jgi:hypothetical protein
MILAVFVGVWSLLVLRRPEVRVAFDAAPPLPPPFIAGQRTTSYYLHAETRFPWPVAERTAKNPKLFWMKLAMWASIIVGALCLVSILWAILCLPFFSLAYLIYMTSVSISRLHGRWIPVDGQAGWVGFLEGGIFRREDSTVCTFAVLPNQKFIDILACGELVDSCRVLTWHTSTLEVQDMSGAVRSYKKSKTLAKKQESFVLEESHQDRSHLLHGKWEPVSGDGPAIQFTKDGAMIPFDGFAARYYLKGTPPNEVIIIHVNDNEKVELKVLSLQRDEMVLAGEGGSCHYKRGVSISEAEANRCVKEFSEKLKKVGKAALLTVGAVGAGIAVLGVAAAAASQTRCGRCGFIRSGLQSNCPNCGW